jgi:hypothetical protein
MDSSKKSVNVTVELVGVSAKATTGRVAAKGVSRIGIKTRGKYELDWRTGIGASRLRSAVLSEPAVATTEAACHRSAWPVSAQGLQPAEQSPPAGGPASATAKA